MAVIPFVPQRAIYPQVSIAQRGYKPQLWKFPVLTTPQNVVGWGFTVFIAPKPLPSQRFIYPQMQPGATTPISGGQHIIPIKPLPGSGGGAGGGTVGYGI